MKISIITVSYNSAASIRNTIESVLSQTYPDIEYIVVDGLSNDKTVDIIKEFEPRFDGCMRWISEKDKGMYDAMNKGIRMASGDIIGILNSDDFFSSNHVISQIAEAFSDEKIGVVFGDIHFVKQDNLSKSVRKYSGKNIKPWMFRWGILPPHPSFYARNTLYNELGTYDISFDISGDYELMIRFLYVHKSKYKYLNFDMVAMRLGGTSTKSFKTILVDNNKNVIRACLTNGLYTNIFMVSIRYIKKMIELLIK